VRMLNPLFIRQANSSLLSQLPFDIVEDITEHLSRNDLCSLMLASRQCTSLAARALYSNIPLRTSSNDDTDCRAHHTLRRRQFAFFVAISQHPHYARFVRRIEFEFIGRDDEPSVYDFPVPTDLVWRTFAKCLGVVYIDLKATRPLRVPLDEPQTAILPNLRRARLEGPFSGRTLDRLLNTSRSIKTLELSITSPFQPSPHSPQGFSFHQRPNAGPFDDLQGDFPSLKTLNILIHPSLSVTSLATFLQRISDHVNLLILRFSHAGAPEMSDDDGYWTSWITENLVGFKVLEQLWLRGLLPDDKLTQQLQKSCPCLKSIQVSGKDNIPKC